jgi:hypothetical protein
MFFLGQFMPNKIACISFNLFVYGLWTEASLIIVLSKYKYQFLWNYEIFNVRCVECKWWFNMLKDVIGFIISSIGGISLAYSLVNILMIHKYIRGQTLPKR